MPRDGAGNYNLPAGNPVVAGTTILDTWANNTLSDVSSSLTLSMTRDGQGIPTADIPFGGHKITGLGDPVNPQDAMTLNYYSSRIPTLFDGLNSSEITDIITRTASIDVTAKLQATINSYSTRGALIIAPSGKYLISGITIPAKVKIFGSQDGVEFIPTGTGVQLIKLIGTSAGIDGCLLSNDSLYANVNGLALAPSDESNTAIKVDINFCYVANIRATDMQVAFRLRPGAHTGSGDSNLFYNTLINCNSQRSYYGFWIQLPINNTGSGANANYFYSCRAGEVGSTIGSTYGLVIDGGTELSFHNSSFEGIQNTHGSTVTPFGIIINQGTDAGYANAPTANIKFFSPRFEANTYDLFQSSTVTDVEWFGWNKTPTSNVSYPLNTASTFTRNYNLGSGTINYFQNMFTVNQSGIGTNNPYYKFQVLGSNFKVGNVETVAAISSQDAISSGATALQIYFQLGNAPLLANRTVGIGGQDLASGGVELQLNPLGNNVRPGVDNSQTIGTAPARWSTGYFATAPVVGSDENIKKDITDSYLGLDFINKLNPISYKYKVGNKTLKIIEPAKYENKEIESAIFDKQGNLIKEALTQSKLISEAVTKIEEFEGKRTHFGLGARQVKAVLDELKINDFGGYVQFDINDPESEVALRYEEFIAPMIKAIQELSEKINKIESKIN